MLVRGRTVGAISGRGGKEMAVALTLFGGSIEGAVIRAVEAGSGGCVPDGAAGNAGVVFQEEGSFGGTNAGGIGFVVDESLGAFNTDIESEVKEVGGGAEHADAVGCG